MPPRDVSMSSARAEAHPPLFSRHMGVVLALLLALALVGCSDSTPPADRAPTTTRAGEGVPVPADLAAAFTATLDERARAILRRDRTAFLRGIKRNNPGLVTAQSAYFDNLAQLPLERFGYELDRSSMVRAGDQYWVVVEVTTQLDGFDPEPVTARDRFRFAAARDGRYVVSSVTDEKWERTNAIRPQPWDLVPIQVRTRPGVLGIFDGESVASAEPILDSVEQGIDDVSAVVPYGWSRSVVVYALSDLDFIRTLDDLPGGDPEHVDGVAFPVLADDDEVVATRFALHPSMVDQPGPERDRLVRHELTHVALGERDDRAPAWLAEGIAEWVSVQPLVPELRRLPEEALAAAEAGVRQLPADDTFNDADSAAHYGLSWWACEYLVAGFGADSLWRLLEALDEPGADQGEVLMRQVGLTGRQLAKRGATMMINQYDPDFLVSEEPEPDPEPDPEPELEPEPQPGGTGG